jgi:hypothetical protein
MNCLFVYSHLSNFSSYPNRRNMAEKLLKRRKTPNQSINQSSYPTAVITEFVNNF